MREHKVVALGGGHGLAATLQALRRHTSDITAVVTVADNGGSSGRLREEFNFLPPGDLRMALAALCGDDTWGRGWAEILQHRFTSKGDLGGHALGNLLLTALWEQNPDPIYGLKRVGELLRVVGKVLPMSLTPLDIEATFLDGDQERIVRGQTQVAVAPGRVSSLRLIPANPEPTPEVLQAIEEADVITLGPGSWISSVAPHFLIRAEIEAIISSKAKKIVLFNLLENGQTKEMARYTPSEHLALLLNLSPSFTFDIGLIDKQVIATDPDVEVLVESSGGRVVSADLCDIHNPLHHDIEKLNLAFGHIFS